MGVDPYLIAPTLKIAMYKGLHVHCVMALVEGVYRQGTKGRIEKAFKTLPTKFPQSFPKNKPCYTRSTAVVPPAIVSVRPLLSARNQRRDARAHFTQCFRRGILPSVENGLLRCKKMPSIESAQSWIPYEEMNVFNTKIGMDIEIDSNHLTLCTKPMTLSITTTDIEVSKL